MGMFDSICIDIKCPKCGKTSEMECQTKETECMLRTWRKGDNIGTTKFNYLDCLTSCDKCSKKGGNYFYLNVHIVNGIVTGTYMICDDNK